jgi:hypothetical protein
MQWTTGADLKVTTMCVLVLVVVRRNPGLNGIHPVEASSRSVDAGRIPFVDVVLLVLTKAPPAQLVVEFPAAGSKASRHPTQGTIPWPASYNNAAFWAT